MALGNCAYPFKLQSVVYMRKLLFVILSIIIFIVAIFIFRNELINTPTYISIQGKEQTPSITIDAHTFTLLLAKTQQEQEKGLGYRTSLPQDQGMLFIFPHPYREEFWMKGMQFPLDIIYIKDSRIITIFESVPNPTIQNGSIRTVTPTDSANDVLEINAGLVKKYNFRLGDVVKISHI